MRFDNGRPWATPHVRAPNAFTLWLVGLGIQPMFGQPRQSTDNAIVERSHGVLVKWVEPEQCVDPYDLQNRLSYFVHIQRAVYPSCQRGSRFDQYPQLHIPLRPYAAAEEEALWDVQKVYDYVAQYRFTRAVEKNGRITLMTDEYSVGRAYAAQKVTAYFDPQQGCWIVEDRQGEVIAQFVAHQLRYLAIANLEMRYRNR
jgi:hypothetical protein